MTNSTISPTDFSEEDFDVYYECPECGEVLLIVKNKNLPAQQILRCEKCQEDRRLSTHQAKTIKVRNN